jgi:alpha-ketoglutarate-dependent taurine dioxygenase
MKLLFQCVQPAQKNGRTPLADMVRVTAAIDPAVREEFERRQVRYVRNYRAGVDLPWQEVFGTGNRSDVEGFCAAQQISLEWQPEGLRTTQVCQAFATHPATGDRVWFNQAHLFHISALEANARQMMLSFFGEQGLPRNAYFGDGGEIPVDVLEHVRGVFADHRVFFDWHADDVLLIDNMLVAHGREPYEGPRRVLVCMSEPHSERGVDSQARAGETEMVTLHV